MTYNMSSGTLLPTVCLLHLSELHFVLLLRPHVCTLWFKAVNVVLQQRLQVVTDFDNFSQHINKK